MKKPILEVVPISPDDKFKQTHIYNRVAASWQAQFLMEVVKIQLATQWPDGLTDKGETIYKVPNAEDLTTRAFGIVDAVLQELEKRRWVEDMPPFAELVDKERGGRTGFVVENRNGQADQGGTPLPAAK